MSAVSQALDHVRELIDTAMPRSSPASRQLRAHGFGTGKLLRPSFIVTIAYDLGCERHHDVLASAAAAELLHEASLIHDDILDDASTRRGKPTIRLSHGDPVAILLGDKLLAAANRIIATIEHAEIRRLLTYTTEATIRSALIQHGGIYKTPATTGECLRCIGKLTAAAFRAGAVIPATITNLRSAHRHALACHGLAFGTAYQLHDDAADIAEDLLIGRVSYATLLMRQHGASVDAASAETMAQAQAYLARALRPPLPLPSHAAWLAQALASAERRSRPIHAAPPAIPLPAIPATA